MADGDSEEVLFLKMWAADNQSVFEPEGEVGFGRECVGITRHDKYINLGPPKQMGEYWTQDISDDAFPPEEVLHAYHKHDCLCVLGRGEERIHELYLWVWNLKKMGFTVHATPRQTTDALDLIFSGIYNVYLDRP